MVEITRVTSRTARDAAFRELRAAGVKRMRSTTARVLQGGRFVAGYVIEADIPTR